MDKYKVTELSITLIEEVVEPNGIDNLSDLAVKLAVPETELSKQLLGHDTFRLSLMMLILKTFHVPKPTQRSMYHLLIDNNFLLGGSLV